MAFVRLDKTFGTQRARSIALGWMNIEAMVIVRLRVLPIFIRTIGDDTAMRSSFCFGALFDGFSRER